MRNFLRLAEGLPTIQALNSLMMQEDLWGENDWRTKYKGTPHGEVDDIWLRYSPPPTVADPDSLELAIVDYTSVWYPAWKRLPQIHRTVFDLLRLVEAYSLERVLITRLRPGGVIHPHADKGVAYTDQGDIARYHVVLQGLPGSIFRCGDEEVCMRTGEIWLFNALETHSCQNNSSDWRIHLLVDAKLANVGDAR